MSDELCLNVIIMWPEEEACDFQCTKPDGHESEWHSDDTLWWKDDGTYEWEDPDANP